jgi:hypothetical protein
MRFMISVIDSQTRSPHSPQEIKAINDFNDKIEAAGQRIMACGMESPTTAIVMDYRNGKKESFNGPLIDSPEFVSGFWIISANSLDEAKALAIQGSQACNRKVELRQLIGN